MSVYEKILKALEACNFDEFTDDGCYEAVYKQLDFNVFDKTYESGITKMVLFPTGLDFVIKLPFLGTWEYKNIYDEEEDDWFEELTLCPFEGAEEPEGWNYCEAEVIRYESACVEGAEEFFLPIKYIGSVHGQPVYIQPKASIFEHSHNPSHYPESKRRRTQEICENLNVWCFNSCWISDFLDTFTHKDLQLLDTMITDLHISDLHDENIGYWDGIPVIVDYADFYS